MIFCLACVGLALGSAVYALTDIISGEVELRKSLKAINDWKKSI